jgi:hypothetical protein
MRYGCLPQRGLDCNIYAPSGTSNKQEKEEFYNVELTYPLWSIPPTMIIGEDFNCVLSRTDCTRNMNHIKALHKVVRGFDLTDAWEPIPPRAIHMNYTPHGAAHLEPMYVSPNLRSRKSGVETIMAAFTDHLVACMRITLDPPMLRKGRGRGTMNIELLDETTFRGKLQQEWSRWRQQARKCLDSVTSWENCQKENPLHVHKRRKQEVMGRCDELKFLLKMYTSIRHSVEPDPT